MDKNVAAISVFKAKAGELSLRAVLSDGRVNHLHSSYEPKKEAAEWAQQVKLTPHTVYLIFGLGLGYHVHELLKLLPENCRIYVFEQSPQINLPELAQRTVPEGGWWEDSRIKLLTGDKVRLLAGTILGCMRSDKINKVTVCRYYPSWQLAQEFYAKLEKELVNMLEDLFFMDMSFYGQSGLAAMRNRWKNIPYFYSNPGINILKDRFKGVPAVVVSSGPSLDKNIRELKKHSSRAIIIASSSSIGALRRYGIVPHFIVVADPFKDDRVYEEVRQPFYSQSAMIALHDSYFKQFGAHTGLRFFCTNSSAPAEDEVARLCPSTDGLQQSGSVATMAFSFAQYIGANPIVFVGQDLALGPIVKEVDEPDGKGGTVRMRYFKYSTPDTVTNDVVPLPAEETTYVLGQNGEKLLTRYVFKEVLDAFQMLISFAPHLTVINATEGGAFMEGAQHMTLQQTAEQYFSTHSYIDFTEQLKRIHNTFAAKNGKLLIDEIQGICQQTNVFINTWDSRFAAHSDTIPAAVLDEYFAAVKQADFYTYLFRYLDAYIDILTYALRSNNTGQQLNGLYTIVKTEVDRGLKEFAKLTAECLAELKERVEAGDE